MNVKKNLMQTARLILEKQVSNKKCITYRDFAASMGFTQAPIIASVTQLLERLIEQDVTSGKPILASMVIQQGRPSIPRAGFFKKLEDCGMVEISNVNFNPELWHQQELRKLFNDI